jgi:hypothetical protein
MGAIRTSANTKLRDFVTDGLPASGAHAPVKSELRTLFGEVEDAIDAVDAIADTAVAGVIYKEAVRVRATGNVVIASALENGDTLNGVTLATGDRVFLPYQDTASQNGVYVVPASGAASRATDMDSAAELARAGFAIKEGTAGAGERWTLPLAASAITLGTTALTFVQIGVEIDVAADVAALETQVGTTQNVGWANPIVATGTDTAVDYCIVINDAVDTDGYLTSISVGADDTAGSATVFVCTMSGTTPTIVEDSGVPRSMGIGLINGVGVFPAALRVEAGQYVGISGGQYKFQIGTNPEGIGAWQGASGVPDGATALTLSTAHRFEVQFTIKTGHEGDISRLLNANDLPYEQTFVGGVRFFEPTARSQINLYDGFRTALAEHIYQNDVLCFVGDSITHWAFAETGAAHYLNRITAFANKDIAADEPVMTALRSYSTYTPAFYGVTYSGTTSAGTRGPLNAVDGPQSVILAAGASINFTGAYERVGVHYTRETGAGVLTFAYNGGSAFHTVDANGSLLVNQLAIDDTGQTASGNYTITAVGGPVEIISLIRLGVKAANSRPRLRTARIARGGYVFNNFDAATYTSILAIGTYAGGKAVPVICLGTNDFPGVDPASVVTQAQTMIDAFQAGGVERIYAVMPYRTTMTYTGGRTYDAALGALRKLYRQEGVIVLPTDKVDFLSLGLLGDGTHPGNDGNDKMAQVIVETIANL